MIQVIIFIAIFAAGLATGWGLGTDHEKAKLADAHAAALVEKDRLIEEERITNGAVSTELNQARAGRETDRELFERRLRNAQRANTKLVTVQCPGGRAAGIAGVPDAPNAADHRLRFTADFVRLWNDGLAIGATEGERARRTDGDPAGADLLEPTDLIANVGQNAERWAQCRAQVRGWQSWACKHGHAAKAECDGK